MAMRPCAAPRRLNFKRTGMALVLVVSVVGVAAVLGYALLAATALQAQVGGNSARSAQAEYLADSGLQLAIWQLQDSSGAWSGQNGISLGSTINGTVSVSSQGVGNNVYQITSISTVNGLQRLAMAQVRLLTPVATSSASGSLLNQLASALTSTGQTGALNNVATAPPVSPANLLNLTWLQANAAQLSNSLNNAVYGPADSPSGVFWTNGNTTLTNSIIRGTLVIYGGNLTLNGNSNRITATANQPALVVATQLKPGGNSVTVIDGGLWVGNQIGASLGGAGSSLNVYGPLTVGDGGVALLYLGSIRVRPLVKVISWNPAAPGN